MKMSSLILSIAMLLPVAVAHADDAAAPAAAPAAADAAPAPAADAPAVSVSATGDQVVTVNTGNKTVDAAANMVAKCAEKKAAMTACGGGFKGMACKKGLEMVKYKGVECPGD